MKTSWMDVKCECGFVWNIRAPSLKDVALAYQEGRIVCLRCGKRPRLDYPPYAELLAEMHGGKPPNEG